MISFINEPDGLSAGFGVHGLFDIIHWFKDDLRGDPQFGPEMVFDLFLKGFGGLPAADVDHDLVGANGVGIYFNIVINNMVDIVENIVKCRRIESGALVFDHLLLSAQHRSQAHGGPATAAGFGVMIAYIAGFKAQQRHSFHAEGGDGHFAGFMPGNRLIVIIQEFHDDQLGVMMPAAAMNAFGERSAHLRGGIGGIELNVPFFTDLPAECGQREIGVSQRFADADCLFYTGGTVVNAVFFGVFNEFQDEGGDGDEGVGFEATDGVPLQFGHSIADTDHSCSELSHPQEVGQSGHETPVDRGHELVGVVRGTVGYSEGNGFVVRQPVQIIVGHGESDRITQCSGSGDVVDDLVPGDTDEILVVVLQVILGGYGNLYEVFQCFYFGDVNMVLQEMLLVEF